MTPNLGHFTTSREGRALKKTALDYQICQHWGENSNSMGYVCSVLNGTRQRIWPQCQPTEGTQLGGVGTLETCWERSPALCILKTWAWGKEITTAPVHSVFMALSTLHFVLQLLMNISELLMKGKTRFNSFLYPQCVAFNRRLISVSWMNKWL